jgi:hypothetical protein
MLGFIEQSLSTVKTAARMVLIGNFKKKEDPEHEKRKDRDVSQVSCFRQSHFKLSYILVPVQRQKSLSFLSLVLGGFSPIKTPIPDYRNNIQVSCFFSSPF